MENNYQIFTYEITVLSGLLPKGREGKKSQVTVYKLQTLGQAASDITQSAPSFHVAVLEVSLRSVVFLTRPTPPHSQ